MNDIYKKYLFRWILLHVFADLTATLSAWFIAYYLRFSIQFLAGTGFADFHQYLKAAGLLAVFAPICYLQAGLYDTRKLDRFHIGYIAITKGLLFLIIVFLAALFFYRDFSFSRLFTVYFIGITFSLIISFRYLVKKIRQHNVSGLLPTRKIILIGCGKTAQKFLSTLETIRDFRFHIIETVGVGNRVPEVAVSAELDQLGDILEHNRVDEVFVALDIEDSGALKKINTFLVTTHADVNHVPDIYHSINLNPLLIDLNGLPILMLRQSPILGWNTLFKRLFDIVGSLTAIVMFGPIMLVIALAVKLTSPGPVIYKQTRTGLDGRNFSIYKFRSMRADAEKQTGAVWAKADDERTTGLGKFMRKTSLDELPQFFNVLNGDMSLVGPRPERPDLIASFKHNIPNYILRHKVKSGITGWAQVNGWRGNTSLEKRIEYDLYYITNWSIWFDVKIILMTFKSGFINPNAY